jgi:hypothetical protein
MSDLPAATHAAPPTTYDREKLRLIRDMFAKDFSEWWNAQKEATE